MRIERTLQSLVRRIRGNFVRFRVKLMIKRSPGSEDIPLPSYATPESAGLDIRAAVKDEVVIPPGGRAYIPTGFSLAIPPGYQGEVRPRSGLAREFGVGLLNSPGTIDSDYRGELGVILVNLGEKPFTVHRGDRIAQLVIVPVAKARLSLVDELPPSKRGEGGFGHTGRK
ncbi:MAG: dUTP diphosphatase [Acidobacteria bacterium]|nr:dUTP diphosphatase [Acidobacteriota bacterium]